MLRNSVFSSRESWLNVYNLLESDDFALKQEGLEIIDAWSTRNRLPIAIQITYNLLDLMLRDPYYSGKYDTSDGLKLQYGLILTKSVNGLVDQLQMGKTAEPIEKLAKKLSIPKWLVDLRHDIVHGIKLPDLTVLREGCLFLLNLLFTNYWNPQKELFSTIETATPIISKNYQKIEEILSTNITDITELENFIQKYPYTEGYIRHRIFFILQKYCDNSQLITLLTPLLTLWKNNKIQSSYFYIGLGLTLNWDNGIITNHQ